MNLMTEAYITGVGACLPGGAAQPETCDDTGVFYWLVKTTLGRR